jgi:hypothetical protein
MKCDNSYNSQIKNSLPYQTKKKTGNFGMTTAVDFSIGSFVNSGEVFL